MARAFPLSAPDGRVYAFACGRCHHIPQTGEYLVERDGPDADIVESSRRMATCCCTCKRCGAEIGRKFLEPRVCADCRPAHDAEKAARDAEWNARRIADQAALEGSLTKALDRDAAIRLRDAMSDISESCWCAGWLNGLEDALWAYVSGTDVPGHWGQDFVSADEIAELRRLHEKAGGWWFSDDTHGELFVTTDVWTSNLILRVGAERSIGVLVAATE